MATQRKQNDGSTLGPEKPVSPCSKSAPHARELYVIRLLDKKDSEEIPQKDRTESGAKEQHIGTTTNTLHKPTEAQMPVILTNGRMKTPSKQILQL